MDHGHELTDQILGGLETRIVDEYAVAVREMQEKVTAYFRQFEEDEKRWQAAVDAGERTEEDFQNWRFRHEMMGKPWQELRKTLSRDLAHAREVALGNTTQVMPDVYALNGNYATYQIEHDYRIKTGFSLYNHDTAEYLLGDQRQLMPGPSTRRAAEIAADRAMQWDQGKIQSAILQGVLQGETPTEIARRLMGVGRMDCNAAIRYARTMTTSAQNAGRYEAFHRAADLGVDLVIEWQAVLDSHTRHEHRMMHGQRRNLDEPFVITEANGDTFEIRYPADCSGSSDVPQGEIWNCRCTLLSWVKGFEGTTVTSSPDLGDMTFEEWQREGVETEETQQTEPAGRTAAEIFAASREFSTDYHEQTNFSRDEWDSMTSAERQGVRRYTGSYFTEMNRALREGRFNSAGSRIQDFILGCTSALNRFQVAEDTLLFRGMGRASTLARCIGISERELVRAIGDGSIVGMRFCERGFCSAGVNGRAGWSKPVTMTIGVPKGTTGMYVDLVSSVPGEHELLLQNGTWFEILGATASTSRYGDIKIHLDVAVVDQTPDENTMD